MQSESDDTASGGNYYGGKKNPVAEYKVMNDVCKLSEGWVVVE